VPVTFPDMSEARNKAALAQSSAVLGLPVGTNDPYMSISSWVQGLKASSAPRLKLVRMLAGAKALTLIPWAATSTARLLVSWRPPALVTP